MAQVSRKAGSTSNKLFVRLLDSSKSDGSGLAGIVAADLTCYYKRDADAAAAAVTLTGTVTLGTYASGGLKLVDDTHAPGLVEFHPPDAAMAAGAKEVVFYFMTAGAKAIKQEAFAVELTAVDNQVGTNFGLSCLPTANPNNANGLLTFGTGAGQINVDGNGQVLIGDRFKKGQALPNYMFVMTDSTTHGPKTGLGAALTITRNLDGAGFAAGTIASPGEIGSGWYKFDIGAGDMNGNCIAYRVQGTGADDLDFTILTQP